MNDEVEQEEDTLSPVINQLGKKLDCLMEEQSLFLNSDLSRDDLVAALGTNRTYLNILLSARGFTFYQYINHLRIDYACRLIQTSSDTSIKDIAVSSGFNNHESFTRQFKAIVGVTPSEYAKNPTTTPILSPYTAR